MKKSDDRGKWFEDARFGMFIHFGLYSMLGRGEWVMNREVIPPGEYAKLAEKFNPKHFDADKICDMAIRSGMRYIVFTTMHHDGFRMFKSELSDYNVFKYTGRDLTEELVKAARKKGLRICLYHSLNNWFDQPDSVAALESKKDYEKFISATFDRIRELVTKFNPIDCLWYDGWWPFNAEGWRGIEMNKMVRMIQPHIIFNGRNGLPGDFSTPEGHISAPTPWRPWEACMTLNDHWGYCKNDDNWKSAGTIIEMLAKVANQKGNLLLNVGPKGDGSIPRKTIKILKKLRDWMEFNGECFYDTDTFTFDLQEKGKHRGDWVPHGHLTIKDKDMFMITRYWPGSQFVISGLEGGVKEVMLLGKKPKKISFSEKNGVLSLLGLPDKTPSFCPVFRIKFNSPPSIYCTGGMRNPRVPHPHYDPCPSDIQN